MGSQEDAALVRRGYEAFRTGDVNTLRDLFAEGAVWQGGGTGPLSGDNRAGMRTTAAIEHHLGVGAADTGVTGNVVVQEPIPSPRQEPVAAATA